MCNYHVWGMDISFEDGDGITFDLHPDTLTEAEMEVATRILKQGTHAELKQLRAAVLKQLCKDVILDWRGRKGLLIERLIDYVSLPFHHVHVCPHSTNSTMIEATSGVVCSFWQAREIESIPNPIIRPR